MFITEVEWFRLEKFLNARSPSGVEVRVQELIL